MREEVSRSTTKPTKWPVKTKISLGIRPYWSEASLSAWRNIGPLATHLGHSEYSDQTGWMPRLIWVFIGCTGSASFVMLRLKCVSLTHFGPFRSYASFADSLNSFSDLILHYLWIYREHTTFENSISSMSDPNDPSIPKGQANANNNTTDLYCCMGNVLLRPPYNDPFGFLTI